MSLQNIKTIIEGSIEVKQALLNDQHLVTEIEKIVHAITNAFKQGNAVYFAGNGGSAADAQHTGDLHACDLGCRTYMHYLLPAPAELYRRAETALRHDDQPRNLPENQQRLHVS